MGNVFKGKTKTQESSQRTALPDWLENASKAAIQRSETIANQPYQAYTGQRVTPLSANENKALGIADATAGAGAPSIAMMQGLATDAAGGLNRNLYQDSAGIKAAGAPITDMDLSAYMNPYTKMALDPVVRELAETSARNQNEINAGAASRGAFGGSRHAMLNSQEYEAHKQAVSDTLARGYQSAFDRATSLANSDRARELSAAQGYYNANAGIQNLINQTRGQAADIAGNAASLESGMADAAIRRLGITGANEREVSDRELATQYGDFVEGRDWGIRNLNAQLAALGQVPYGATVYGTQQVEKPSLFSQIAGLGSSAAGAYMALSDENKKTDRKAVNPEEVLAKFASLPVDTYRYTPEAILEMAGEGGGERIGPMSQDFARLFGGEDDKVIPMPKLMGEVVAAIKGLEARTTKQAA